MAQTQLPGTKITNATIGRSDLDTVTAGEAVIRKVLAGTNVTITSTGTDAGTGDVTINVASIPASPAGSTTQIQYNNAGTLAGAANVEIQSDELVLVTNSSPTNPGTGELKLNALTKSGIVDLNIVNSKGQKWRIQPEGRFMARFQAYSNSAVLTGHTGLLFAATGTATAVAASSTSRYTRTSRVEALVTTPSTTAVAGFRAANAIIYSGSGTAEGGYWCQIIGGPATGVATATSRFWMGIGQTAAPTDVNPSTVNATIGFGYDSADATIQIMTKGTGAVVKTNTGIAVPTADRSALYELTVYQPPGATQEAYITLVDLINGTVFEHVETTAGNLPASNTSMTPKLYSSAGGTSSVIGVALHSCRITSDF